MCANDSARPTLLKTHSRGEQNERETCGSALSQRRNSRSGLKLMLPQESQRFRSNAPLFSCMDPLTKLCHTLHFKATLMLPRCTKNHIAPQLLSKEITTFMDSRNNSSARSSVIWRPLSYLEKKICEQLVFGLIFYHPCNCKEISS